MVLVVQSWTLTKSGFCWLKRARTSLVAHSLFSRPPIGTWPRMTLNSLADVSLHEGQTSCLPVWPSYKGSQRRRGTDLCLCVYVCACVCVFKAVAGHSLLLVPYFTPPFIWELSSWALTSPLRAVVSFILIHFGQMVDYRSKQKLKATAVTRKYSSGSWSTGCSLLDSICYTSMIFNSFSQVLELRFNQLSHIWMLKP